MLDFAHIGLHKTASTYLQTSLFKYHPNIQKIGTPEELRHFSRSSTEKFNLSYWQAWYKDQLNTISTDTKKIGVTSEWLSGSGLTANLREENVQRIKDVFNPRKIIIVLRHPQTMITSRYNQEIRNGDSRNAQNWLKENELGLCHMLDYSTLYNLYQDLVGTKNVLILPYELLKKEKTLFIEKITAYIGVVPFDPSLIKGHKIQTNVSVSEISQKIMLIQNNLINLHGKRTLKKRILQRIALLIGTPLIFPKSPQIPIEKIRSFPVLGRQLTEKNYEIWTGSLAAYNYRF